jgi:protein SCO1/2
LHAWGFVAAVVLLPVTVYALVQWYQNKYETLPVLGEKGHTVGSFQFIDQYSSPATDDAWKGKIVVANYFFTHCPSICPKMVYQLKRVQTYAGNDIIITSFSVDPERDTPGKLRLYAEQFNIGRNWLLLTGNKKDLYRFARKELLLVATDGDGGPNDFIHSENLVLIDKQKRIRGYYNGTEINEVNKLVSDIKKLQRKD